MTITFCYSAASGANDGTSWTDAFTSLNNALAAANIAPGALVLVSGTFNETVTVAEVGTVSAVNVVQGDDRSGGAGAGAAATFLIDGQSTRTNCLDTSLANNTQTYYCFKNMRCTGATGDNIAFGNLRTVTYKDCRTDTSGGDGIDCTNSLHSFERCEIDGNSGNGILGSSGITAFCKIHGNGANGANTVAFTHYMSLFYNNSSPDVEDSSTSGSIHVLGCTVDGDGKTTQGIRFDGSSHRGHAVLNTIIDNVDGVGGVGYLSNSNDLGEVALSSYNLVNNNTSNYSNAATFTGEVTAAPGFTNQGADDYTLSGSGAADGAGGDNSS